MWPGWPRLEVSLPCVLEKGQCVGRVRCGSRCCQGPQTSRTWRLWCGSWSWMQVDMGMGLVAGEALAQIVMVVRSVAELGRDAGCGQCGPCNYGGLCRRSLLRHSNEEPLVQCCCLVFSCFPPFFSANFVFSSNSNPMLFVLTPILFLLCCFSCPILFVFCRRVRFGLCPFLGQFCP